MKILILVDVLNNWALHNRAKAIKKFLPQHDVEIRAALDGVGDIPDHGKFDVVHFNFTWGLDCYLDFITRHRHKCMLTVVNERSLLQGIGIKPINMDRFKKLFTICPYKTAVNIKMADLTGGIYIPNGIDDEIFDECRIPIVGYSGTGMPNKNAHLVEKACQELGLKFLVAGYRYKGDEGRVPDFAHENMQDFYKRIDVFVHASATEGFSNTIIEALAGNVPVIMTRQGAWQEFEGWVDFIEPTVVDIKRALQKFTGRILINHKFLWKTVILKYEEIYLRIYENNQRI